MENKTQSVAVTTTKDGAIKPKPKPIPKLYSAFDLEQEDLPPIKYLVDSLITEGVCIISSKPKMGKSFLVLQLCLSVANGENFLGLHTEQGEALYFDFESSKSLQQNRLRKMLKGRTAPRGLYYVSEDVPRMGEGFEEYLITILEEHPKIKVVVVDVFRHIQSKKRATESDYDFVYQDISKLKEIADGLHISIILVTHNRKMVDPTDPFSDLLGSTGLMGASDETIVIYKKERKSKEATISITGRTVEQNDFVATFNKNMCNWELKGEAEIYEAEQEERRYNQNPIVATIKKCLDMNNGAWEGKASELIMASEYYKTQIRDSEKVLGRKMESIAKELWMYDCIQMERKKKAGMNIYRFYKTITFDESNTPFKE